MKNLAILITICIACVACEKKDNEEFGYKFKTHFTLDSVYSDRNNYTPNIKEINTIANPNNSFNFIGTGKVDGCLKLTGSAYIECSKLFSNFLTLEKVDSLKKYSISFWFKINDVSNSAKIFTSNDRAGGGLDIYISDSLVLNYLNTNISVNHINKKFAPVNNDWNNIIIVYNSTSFSLYFNGVEVYSDNSITKISYLSSFYFGNRNESSNLFMNLDDINIWNYPITSTEVINYYNATK
jgi:hypothetical protein